MSPQGTPSLDRVSAVSTSSVWSSQGKVKESLTSLFTRAMKYNTSEGSDKQRREPAKRLRADTVVRGRRENEHRRGEGPDVGIDLPAREKERMRL